MEVDSSELEDQSESIDESEVVTVKKGPTNPLAGSTPDEIAEAVVTKILGKVILAKS